MLDNNPIKKAFPWWIGAILFLSITYGYNNYIPIYYLVSSFSSSLDIKLILGFVFLAGLLESLFVVSFYWPGTMILLGIAAITKDPIVLCLEIVTAVCSVTLGCCITYYIFNKFVRSIVHVPQRNFIDLSEGMYIKFHSFAIVIMSIQPTFLTSLFAYAGFKGHDISKYIYLSIPSMLVLFSFYATCSSVVFSSNTIRSGSGNYFISAILFCVGIFAAYRDYSLRKSLRP